MNATPLSEQTIAVEPAGGSEREWVAASHPRRIAAFFTDLIFLDLIEWFYIQLASMAVQSASAGPFPQAADASILSPTWNAGLSLGLFLVYFIYFGVQGGQTPGKMIFRMQIVRRDGRPLTFGQSVVRGFGYFASFVTVIGVLLPIFNSERRALHDLLAGTRVVRR